MLNTRRSYRLWAPILEMDLAKPTPVVRPKIDAAQYEHHPVRFSQELLGFEPDERQREILTAQHKRIIICASRQWGKSTVTAAKAVHHAWFHPNSLVLVLSPSERQSAEFIRKVESFVRHLGVKLKGDGDNACSLILPNGTRIVGLPGSEATNRGFSAPSLVLIDEASRVDDGLYFAIRPMLATSNGQLIIMSTPLGRRGFFWEEWSSKGNPDWLKISVKATDCPRIGKQFLSEEIMRLSSDFYQQEYLCEFKADAQGLFKESDLERCWSDDVQPLFQNKP
jgi:hypothetical protein